MESLDVLYITISVSIALITVFLSITMLYFMFIIRDFVKILDKAKEVVEKVDRYITKPLLMTKSIIEFIKPFIENAESSVKRRRKKG